jgi:two-component system, NarL family, sensor kinase
MEKQATDIYLFIITGVIILNALLGFIVYFMLMYRRKQRLNQLEKTQLLMRFQQNLLQTQLEIQEQTFKNISLEIHDNIGQILSLAKLTLSSIEMSDPALTQEKALSAKNLVSKAVQDLRDLSRSLNTDYVSQMGLARAIEYSLENIKKTSLFETEMTIAGAIKPFDPQRELIIFRIAQEMLNNIIKHATATIIRVALEYGEDSFRLIITDNGKGFDLSPIAGNAASGLGIRNMHSRAELIGAGFHISSTIGEGSAVSLTIKNKAFI